MFLFTATVENVDVETIRTIEALKYRYLRTLDLKEWDAFADTLSADVSADYGAKLRFTGREQVVGFMRDSLGPSVITVHHCHHPEITIDGDTASGTWYLEDKVIVTEHRIMLTGAAFYDDRYVHEADGQWRISSTGYVRNYETVQSLEDIPSWRLTSNRWASA